MSCQIFDEKGPEELSAVVEADLEDIFPYPVPPRSLQPGEDEEGEEGEREASVDDHISLAWQVGDRLNRCSGRRCEITSQRQHIFLIFHEL